MPATLVLGLILLELLALAGQTWAGRALTQPVLGSLSVLTAVWALLALREQAGTLGNRAESRQNRSLHNAWRARTIAWDVLILAIASLGLVIANWAGPTRIIPPRDLSIVEIAVLVVTAALLATFARYTAMAFSTDVDSLVNRLESLSHEERVHQTRETERISGSFEREVAKLITRVDRQVAATEEGLKAVAGQLELISKTLAAQAQLSKEVAAAQEAAAKAQRQAAEEASKREGERRLEAARALSLRADQIRPHLQMRLDSSGTLFHSLTLTFQNDGGRAECLRVEIRHSGGVYIPPPIPSIASGDRKAVELGDVTDFHLSTAFGVEVTARDVDGNRHVFRAGVGYARTTGFWGQTKTVTIQPGGWIPMTRI